MLVSAILIAMGLALKKNLKKNEVDEDMNLNEYLLLKA